MRLVKLTIKKFQAIPRRDKALHFWSELGTESPTMLQGSLDDELNASGEKSFDLE